MGAALALAGVGIPGLWESHEQPIIRSYLTAADDLDFPGGPGGRRPERLDALLDGRDRPQQLALQVLHDLRGVAVGGPARLLGLRRGLLEHGLGLLLGALDQVVLADHGLGPFSGFADRPGRLRLRFGKEALLLLQRPAGLLDLVRKAQPQVVDTGQYFFLVDDDGAGQRNLPAVADEVFEAIDGFMDVHACAPLLRRCLSGPTTLAGTNSEMSPPNSASPLIKLELRNRWRRLVGMKTVVTSGSSRRFISAIWNSLSKSDTARSPRTITRAPTWRAKSMGRALEVLSSSPARATRLTLVIATRP